MPEEPLFEVWVNGWPELSDEERPILRSLGNAVAREKWLKRCGLEAVVVPDQSKRPPDEEMLQDR